METGWLIESLLLCNISQKRKCALLFQMDFKGNKHPSGLARFICWVSLSSHLSLFKLLLKPFSFLALICLRSTAVEPTFLKANLRQLSWMCLLLTNAPPFCVSLNPGVSDKVVMCSLLLHVPTHPPQDSVVVLFKNNRKVEHCQTLHSGYPRFAECQVESQPGQMYLSLTFQNKLKQSPTCFPPQNEHISKGSDSFYSHVLWLVS